MLNMRKIQFIILVLTLTLGFYANANAQVRIIETYAGTGTASYTGDGGSAATATLNQPNMINFDGSGNLYIADNSNTRVRKINLATGIITLVAGGGTTGTGGDGLAATASGVQFGAGGFNPGLAGVAVDATGNVYITDGTNNKIRVVSAATGIISTFAGTGTAGSTGDGGPASSALLSAPRGIHVDAANNLYIADAANNKIRKVDLTTGIINTVAGIGTAGSAGDGLAATAAQLSSPRGVCTDAAGNIYIADRTNNKVRKVTVSTGLISTYAGSGTGGFTGDGSTAATAQINRPTDVKMDAAGNLFIADNSNTRVRMVSAAGIITTLAGATGFGGAAGDGQPATAAAVRVSPLSIAVIDSNHFYISDQTNNRIRIVKPNSIPYFTGGSRQTLTVCENSSATSINSLLAVIDSDKSQTLTWSMGTWSPINGTAVVAGTAATNGGTVTPTGKTYTPTPGYSGMDSFIVQISDGYNSSTDTIIVTINPLPVVAAIGGPNTVCQLASITLTETTPGGVWSEITGNATVVGGTVTGVNAGTDDISYAVTNSCGTVTVTQTVTVNPLPDAGSIAGLSTVCVGSSIVLTDLAPGGTWSASNGNASVVGGTVTGITATTTDDISYSVTNGCGTAIATSTVNIIDLLGLGSSLTGPSVVCVGSGITLSSVVAGGVWSESTGNTSVVAGSVTGLFAGTDVINYALSNACGINNISKTVTVNPLPNAGTILGLTSVCLAGTLTLTDAAPGGTWSASNGNATVSGTGLVTGVAVGTDVIAYTVTNSCGTAIASTTINVVSIPSAGTIAGPATVCQGANITLTDGVPGGVWSAGNANATVAGGVVTGVSAGTDVISYTVSFSCGSAFTTQTITINPLPVVAAISGSANVCLMGTTSLSDATPGGAWSASNANATISGTGLVSGLIVGLDVISYSVTNACGTTDVTFSMSIDPVVTPGVSITATPGFTTCPGTSVAYTANPVNGGPSPAYEWKVNTTTVLGTGPGFIYTPVNGDRIICKLTSSFACISSPSVSDTQMVIVNPTLIPSVNIVAGITGDTVCIGDLATYTASSSNGGLTPTYQWNVNGLVYAMGNPFSYSPANGDVVTCSMTSSYVCPMPATVTSNSITMTVNTTELPAVNITVTPGDPICAGLPATFSAHALYGGISPFFRWTRNGVNVATGPNYIYLPTNGDIIYAMLGSSATCRTVDSVFSNNITMTVVNPSAITITITATNGTNIGIGQIDTLKAVVTGALSPTYQWFVNGAAIAGATTSEYVVNSSLAGTEVVHCVAGSGDVCANTAISNMLSMTINNVGIKQLGAGQSKMDIYPNPGKGLFYLNIEADNNEPVKVIVSNILGEKVKEFFTTTNLPTKVNMNNAAGVYFVTASTGTINYAARVVIE